MKRFNFRSHSTQPTKSQLLKIQNFFKSNIISATAKRSKKLKILSTLPSGTKGKLFKNWDKKRRWKTPKAKCENYFFQIRDRNMNGRIRK